MLKHITQDGQLHWDCHCGPQHTHISHEGVKWFDEVSVALPCTCGALTLVKVAWSEKELLPPIIYKDSRGKIVDVKKQGAENFTKVLDHYERDAAGKQVRVIDGIEWHPAIARHQEFKRQLEAIGKKPPEN